MRRSPCVAVLLFFVTAAAAQSPRQIAFLGDLPSAHQVARKAGVPVLVAVVAKGERPAEPFTKPEVVARSASLVPVLLVAGTPAAKKLETTPPGGVVLTDDKGKVLAELEPGFTTKTLSDRIDEVLAGARAAALEKVNDDRETATAKRAAFDSYLRMGAGVGELIPLLSHKSAGIRAATAANLVGRAGEGADWVVLGAMAAADPETRAACYPVAVQLARAKGVPPLKFWREAAEEDRAAELEKWRDAAFGKVPPVNRAVVDYCVKHYGKQVNDGECSMLVVDAFVACKVKSPMLVKEYIWGRKLEPGEDALPGDIVQLEGVKFGNGWSYPHHTQVVRKHFGNGRYEVFEQNCAGRRTVGRGEIELKRLLTGSLVIYRPIPAEAGAR